MTSGVKSVWYFLPCSIRFCAW